MHLIHGPNLNLLGTREPSTYGSLSLSQLEQEVCEYASAKGLETVCFQTSSESELLNYVYEIQNLEPVVINAGAWTHTSVALRDALVGCKIDFVEVHISQVHARESFRHRSYLSAKAKAYFSGFGVDGYKLAIDFLATVT